MDLNDFFTMPMFIFSMVIYIITWAQRKSIEMAFPKIVDHKLWRELYLPICPAIIGSILAIIIGTQYQFPVGFTTFWGRVFCGVGCGLFSGTGYRIINKFLSDKLGKENPIKDIAPENSTDTTNPLL